MKNIQDKPNNVDPKLDQIQSKQRHGQVGKHARIPNLTSIHFDYQKVNTILSKWVLIQNQNLRIKTPRNLLLIQIKP